MTENQRKNKGFKDWDRHARIIMLLQKKQITIKELSLAIGENFSHVSACIWGKPSRKNRRIEEKIAVFLSHDWIVLFGEKL
jgi:lambda repressor-like predicted transcriptional regulator